MASVQLDYVCCRCGKLGGVALTIKEAQFVKKLPMGFVWIRAKSDMKEFHSWVEFVTICKSCRFQAKRDWNKFEGCDVTSNDMELHDHIMQHAPFLGQSQYHVQEARQIAKRLSVAERINQMKHSGWIDYTVQDDCGWIDYETRYHCDASASPLPTADSVNSASSDVDM